MHRIQEIKIVYLIGQLGLGGAEQQLFYLLSNLDRKRFSPVVINLAPDQSQGLGSANQGIGRSDLPCASIY